MTKMKRMISRMWEDDIPTKQTIDTKQELAIDNIYVDHIEECQKSVLIIEDIEGIKFIKCIECGERLNKQFGKEMSNLGGMRCV